ncbi:MAG: acyl-CoA thioesterase [Myxococcales bacterium]|nr:MAG: acyl-CoA thioesterase [Myxococcales bacterium]
MSKDPVTLPSVENEIQVRFSDTDAMGHISSGSYAAFAEVGRAAFFKAVPEPREEIPWFVLVHLGLDFVSEGRFGQRFTLSTRVAKLSRKTLTFEQIVRADGEVACRLEVVLVAFDAEARKSIEVPSHWRLAE